MRSIRLTVRTVLAVMIFLLVTIVLGGCSQNKATVESVMRINGSEFVGERIITINFGSELSKNENKRKNVEDIIKDKCPPILSCRSEFSDTNYRCVFVLSFSSVADYKEKVANIIGKQILVAYGNTNTALSKGTYYREDYECVRLTDWLVNALDEKGYGNYLSAVSLASNVIEYNKTVLQSEDKITTASTVTGEEIHGVSVSTRNYKDGKFDRILSITFPKRTYVSMGVALENIMNSRIDAKIARTDWKDSGEYMEFSVSYINITLEQMEELTKKFLECNSSTVYYGDQNNSSTPLAEQLVFEENIHVLSFVSDTGKTAQLSYTYELPEETTHGEGVELIDGEWQSNGNWLKNTYRLNSNEEIYDIRIPDGMQFTIKGMNIRLTSLEEDRFRRETEFVFDRSTGEKGLEYAYRFLYNMGVNVTKENTFDGAICRITNEGNVNDISGSLSEIFGSGNYFEYTKHTGNLSVVTDINATDHINISHMLTGANAHININYTVQSDSSQYIKTMKMTDNANNTSPDIKINKDKSRSVTVESGNFSVGYYATIPYEKGVTLYYILSVSIVVLFMLTVFFLNMSYKKANGKLSLTGNETDFTEISSRKRENRKNATHKTPTQRKSAQKSEQHRTTSRHTTKQHTQRQTVSENDSDKPYNLEDFL